MLFSTKYAWTPNVSALLPSASQMWLEHGDEGPTWKVRLWAESVAHPDHEVNIGDTYILAENGSVIRRDIHIDRLN